jgi:glycosyltransferase involved in cell wall biosynthesis
MSNLGHILIGGTGRSGTSCLVQMLTHLNFDTGFSKDEVLKRVDGISKAGLERSLLHKNLPHVIKSPWFCDEIAEAFERGLRLETVIIPFRNLFDAAESRRHVYRQAESLGKDPLRHPGSIWKTATLSDQEGVLSLQFYKFMEPLVARNVPLIFLSFPRFVEDPEYFYEQLKPIFSRHNVQREQVLRVHGELADPNLVTRFANAAGAAPGQPAAVDSQGLSGGRRDPIPSGMDTYLTAASFQWPNYLESSGWIDHAPFAFWLMDILRPQTFVELGTHNGYSYFAFCQAVEVIGMDTRCYAVDTWKGDEHAGFYGEEVFRRVQQYNERHYANFSRLVRSTFGEALSHFPDASIDLMHIDGRHFYDDVKHDFESWRPKLSDRAVVLFHDTNVRERNFGVFKLWEELRAEFPSFEFLHGHGLGVLGVGASLPEGIAAFFKVTAEPRVAVAVRQSYARLGTTLKADFEARTVQSKLAANLSEQKVRAGEIEAKLAERDVRIAGLEQAVAESGKRVAGLKAQLAAINASRSWRMTAPLRAIRFNIRRMGNCAWVARALGRVALTKGPRAGYRLFKQRRLLLSSGAFDVDYYRRQYPDVVAARIDATLHYLLQGAGEGRNPNAHFDAGCYLQQNPDVAEAGVNPLVHYIRFGASEGRDRGAPFDTGWYLEQNPDPAEAAMNPPGHADEAISIVRSIREKTAKPIIIYESHDLKHQGAPNSLFEIATGVKRRGKFYAVLMSKASGPLAEAYHQQGIDCIIPRISNQLKDPAKREKYIATLADLYKKVGGTLVHVNTLRNFYCILAASRAGIPAVWNIRESEDPDTYYDYLSPDVRELAYSSFGKADTVIFVAEATRQRWRPRLDGVVESVTIPNGIDISRLMRFVYGTSRPALRRTFEVGEKDVLLLNVGTVSPRKGQQDLVDAMKRLSEEARRRIVLAIAGFNANEYSRNVRAQLKELERQGLRVVLVKESASEAERRKVAELYSAADMFVLTSRIESYPRVILEAMEFGLPIISTPCFGVREQLIDGQSCLFYDGGDTEKLCAHIRFLCDRPDERRKFGRAAHERLASLSSYDQMLEAYEAVYSRVLAQRARSGLIRSA